MERGGVFIRRTGARVPSPRKRRLLAGLVGERVTLVNVNWCAKFRSTIKDVLSEQNWLNDKTDRCPQFFSAVTIKLTPKISHKDLY